MLNTVMRQDPYFLGENNEKICSLKNVQSMEVIVFSKVKEERQTWVFAYDYNKFQYIGFDKKDIEKNIMSFICIEIFEPTTLKGFEDLFKRELGADYEVQIVKVSDAYDLFFKKD